MKYLLALYMDENAGRDASPADIKAVMDDYGKFGEEAGAAGAMLGGDGLEPTSTATSVRVRGGERVVTDGPFAETKEQLGGYYLLECKDLDEAIGWAEKIPAAWTGTVEIRPIMDYEARMKGLETATAQAQGA
jgi:hypothetical protein